jgi:uncharacterized RDD family membrane protein YckC
MTMPPAGWYDDPWSPSQYRYWDGNAWTPHAAPKTAPPVQPASPAQPPTGWAPGQSVHPGQAGQAGEAGQGGAGGGAGPTPATPPPYASGYGTPTSSGYETTGQGGSQGGQTGYSGAAPYGPNESGYGQPTQYGPSYPVGGEWQPVFGATTPDGAPLSGWWRRVGARLIDQIIVYLIALPITGYFWVQVGQEIGDEIDRASESSGPFTASGDFYQHLLVASLITLVVAIVYEAYFLRHGGATWGKQLLGIKVRPREHDVQLEWDAIAKRIGVIQGLSLLSAIPGIGFFAGIASLLNYLWPLWDKKRQCWHDKAAGTNVVRTRS